MRHSRPLTVKELECQIENLQKQHKTQIEIDRKKRIRLEIDMDLLKLRIDILENQL